MYEFDVKDDTFNKVSEKWQLKKHYICFWFQLIVISTVF